MMEDNNISAPDPGKREALKEYSFTRIINLKNKLSETPKYENIKIDPKESKTLNLTLSLYPKEISISAKEENKKDKLPNILYETNLSLETLQGYNKFFSILNLEKIFETIQKSFELIYDSIFLEEDKLVIKLMINFMEVVTEELTFELKKIKLSSEEESLLINESIKALTEEKNILKNEVNSLNNTIAELKKISEDRNNELKTIIEEKNNEYLNKLEENKREFQNKIEQKENESKEREKELKTIINEKNNEFKIILEKLQEEMKGVKEIEKYAKEKIIIENDKEKEKNKSSFNRELKYNNNLFNMEITIFLFEAQIKFEIKEIQDNLKNNPKIYETYKKMEDFGRISDYYKKEGGIKSVFEFLIQLFEGAKDKIKKENDEIIIELYYTLGIKEDNIALKLSKKEIGLEATLKNIDKSLKDINKDNIKSNEEISKIKIELKKDLLEKVYPIGSYYWSSSGISPQTLFGGIWRKIQGKFLFASDENHYVGYESGEEKHYLTIDEMPNHSHGYKKFHNDSRYCYRGANDPCDYYPNSNNETFLEDTSTDSKGGGKAHNNMPPYITANCWRRTG